MMGYLFTVPKPVLPKPRLQASVIHSVAGLNTIAGVELGHGHPRAAERLSDLAERLRERLAVLEVAR